jgi:hypothetical protein
MDEEISDGVAIGRLLALLSQVKIADLVCLAASEGRVIRHSTGSALAWRSRRATSICAERAT